MSAGASAAQPDPDPDRGGTSAAPPQSGPDAEPADEVVAQPQPEPGPAHAGASADPVPSGSDFLVTSAEREAAEVRVRSAVADDLIDLDEFGERIQLVLAARTRSELRAAAADLPAGPATARSPDRRDTGAHRVARPARYRRWVISVMGGSETRGRWRPDTTTNALAMMGGTTIDLQHAEFDGDVLVINALAVMGAVEIIVPEGVEVDVSGFALMGGRDVDVSGPIDVRTPLVQVRGVALMGGIEVRHPKPKERRRADKAAGADAPEVPLRGGEYADDANLVARPRPEPRRMSRIQRWLVAALAAAALAVPVGWVAGADDMSGAVFGSGEQAVSAADLEDGSQVVAAPVLFGSVAVRVPANAVVEKDGLVIFGSTECAACNTNPDGGPVVQVRTVGGFGSVEITRAP